MRFKWMVIYPTSYMTFSKVVNQFYEVQVDGYLSYLLHDLNQGLIHLYEVQVDGYLSYLLHDLLQGFLINSMRFKWMVIYPTSFMALIKV